MGPMLSASLQFLRSHSDLLTMEACYRESSASVTAREAVG